MKLQALKNLAIEMYPHTEALFDACRTHGEIQATCRALKFGRVYFTPVCPIEPPKPELFNAVLVAVGMTQIHVIKAVRELTEKGLREAKALTDDAISFGRAQLAENISIERARVFKTRIESVGGKVQIEPVAS
jgi:ribosomal protein L7/L12